MKDKKFHAARIAAADAENRRRPPIKGKNAGPIPVDPKPKRLTELPVPSMGRDRKSFKEIVAEDRRRRNK